MTKSFFVAAFTLLFGVYSQASLAVFGTSSGANSGIGLSESLGNGLGPAREQDRGEITQPSEVAITGTVKFEKRYTRAVPSRSKPYWSLVIDTGTTQYLLNERIDSADTPAAVTLNVVVLRSGSRVRVWGEAIAQNSNFFILLSVKKVSLLKNAGWSCRSSEIDSTTFLAHVWFEMANDQDGSYQMKVQEVIGRSIHQLAYLNPVNFNAQTNQLIFSGQSSNMNIELMIDEVPEKAIDFRGVLKISEPSLKDEGAPLREATIEMICNRTRFSVN